METQTEVKENQIEYTHNQRNGTHLFNKQNKKLFL